MSTCGAVVMWKQLDTVDLKCFDVVELKNDTHTVAHVILIGAHVKGACRSVVLTVAVALNRSIRPRRETRNKPMI
jgi:hypothetical protein